MTRTERDRVRMVDAFLDEGPTQLSPRVRDGVIASLRITRQSRPLWPIGPRLDAWRREASVAAVSVAVAALAVAVIGGLGLPARGPGSSSSSEPTAAAPSPTSAARPSPTAVAPLPTAPASPLPTAAPYLDLGYLGLPPLGAPPNLDGASRLVATYLLHTSLPYRGGAYVFADGRLIWIESAWNGEAHESTGYLQQWLTQDGVDLIAELATGPGDNRGGIYVPGLGARLPATAWRDSTIRPYVPPGYGVCMIVADPDPPFAHQDRPLAEKLSALPTEVRPLLEGVPAAPSTTYDRPPWDCLGLSLGDARALDAALRDAGIHGDDSRGLLAYDIDLDGDGPENWFLDLWFEPLLPDGSVECTSCG